MDELENDWASDLAITIISDVHGRTFKVARAKIAERLRRVRLEGRAISHQEAMNDFNKFFQPDTAELQRECQLDYQEEKDHGWAVE